MDFNELKQDAEKLCKELKDKAPADLSVLVLSLSTIINMMITMFSGIMEQNKASLEQNKKQTATISDMEQTISGLKQTISDLQKTIKDLQRQLNMKLPHEPDEVKVHLPENVKPVHIYAHAQQTDMYLNVPKRDMW